MNITLNILLKKSKIVFYNSHMLVKKKLKGHHILVVFPGATIHCSVLTPLKIPCDSPDLKYSFPVPQSTLLVLLLI